MYEIPQEGMFTGAEPDQGGSYTEIAEWAVHESTSEEDGPEEITPEAV